VRILPRRWLYIPLFVGFALFVLFLLCTVTSHKATGPLVAYSPWMAGVAVVAGGILGVVVAFGVGRDDGAFSDLEKAARAPADYESGVAPGVVVRATWDDRVHADLTALGWVGLRQSLPRVFSLVFDANGLTGYNPRTGRRPLGTVPWSEIGELRAYRALSGGDSEGLFSYPRLRIEFRGALKGRILIVGVD